MEKMSNSLDHTVELMRLSFEKLYTEGKNSDVILQVGNKKFPVHRVILATHSETFQKILYEEAADHNEIITIDAPLVAFEHMLKYLYSGKMNLDILDDIHDVLETLECARSYGLTKLEDDLIEHVTGHVDIENLGSFIKSAEILNYDKMTDMCVKVLNAHSNEFFGCQDFFELNEEEVASVMLHKGLMVTNTQRVEAICEWLRVNWDCSDEVQRLLIATVDLTMLTNKQLIDYVRPTKLCDDEVLFSILRLREDRIKDEVVDKVEPEEETPDKVQPKEKVVDKVEPEEETPDNVQPKEEVVDKVEPKEETPDKVQPKEEVSNEILPKKKPLINPFQLSKVIVGSSSEYLTSKTEFALAAKEKNQWNLVIDLGKIRVFNHMQFNIGEKRCTEFTVEVSKNLFKHDKGDLTWRQIKEHFHCRCMQTMYVPETKARYVRIRGVEKLNDFKVANVSKLPLLQNSWICMENPSTAPVFIECYDKKKKALSHPSLPRTFENMGKDTPFVESGEFCIYFNQPYFIRKFMFRLWDFDGRKQNFTAYAMSKTLESIESKVFEDADGWQVMDVEPNAYIGLTINGKFDMLANQYKGIRVAHVEATK